MNEDFSPIAQRRKNALNGAICKLNSYDGHALSSNSDDSKLFTCVSWPLKRKLKAHGVAIVVSGDNLSAEVKSFAINEASPSQAPAVVTRTVSVDFLTVPAVYRRLGAALDEVYNETKQLESKR